MGELKCVIINLCSIDAFGTLGCHYCITNFLTFKQQRRVHIISLSLWDSYLLSHESCRQQDNGARHWNDVLLISVKAIKLGKALNCHGNLWHCVFQEAPLRHPQSHVRLHELLMYFKRSDWLPTLPSTSTAYPRILPRRFNLLNYFPIPVWSYRTKSHIWILCDECSWCERATTAYLLLIDLYWVGWICLSIPAK